MLWTVDLGQSAGLVEQITANVRRAVAEGALSNGERLPPAADLGRALGVNRNTVLAAYRRLRAEGLLEFRRGRGVTVRVEDAGRVAVAEAVRQLREVGRRHGFTDAELATLLTSVEQGLA